MFSTKIAKKLETSARSLKWIQKLGRENAKPRTAEYAQSIDHTSERLHQGDVRMLGLPVNRVPGILIIEERGFAGSGDKPLKSVPIDGLGSPELVKIRRSNLF